MVYGPSITLEMWASQMAFCANKKLKPCWDVNNKSLNKIGLFVELKSK